MQDAFIPAAENTKSLRFSGVVQVQDSSPFFIYPLSKCCLSIYLQKLNCIVQNYFLVMAT